ENVQGKVARAGHQRKWGLPRYSGMKDGPDHIRKASVYVNCVSFTSGAFSSLKEANNQAAMLAFLSFSSGSSTQTSEHDTREQIGEVKPQDIPIPAQSSVIIDERTLSQTKNKTMQAGSPHMPTFFSTVEVEGVEFHGKGGRSKKQSEENATKIAYIALKECGLNMHAAFSPIQIENKVVQSIYNSDIVKWIKNLKLEDELLDLDLNETSLANVKVSNEMHNPPFIQSPEEEMMINRSSSSCEPSSKAETPTSSYLLCSRFKLHTCFPNIPFDKDL
ncbi:hypothetical protein D0Y65_048035, partial [Glycine soja]